MAVDLVLNLGLCVSHEDGRAVDRGTHLGAGSLESREELSVDQGRLGVLELVGNITRQTEVRILVNGARDQARNVGTIAKDGRESVRERGGGLDRHKVRLSDVIAVIESKSRLGLTVGDAARDADDVVVESTSTNIKKKNVSKTHRLVHAIQLCMSQADNNRS